MRLDESGLLCVGFGTAFGYDFMLAQEMQGTQGATRNCGPSIPIDWVSRSEYTGSGGSAVFLSGTMYESG